MDFLTKQLVDKAAAFNSAFSELWQQDNTLTDVEYVEGQDYSGSFVRAYNEILGYSSKYYYEI